MTDSVSEKRTGGINIRSAVEVSVQNLTSIEREVTIALRNTERYCDQLLRNTILSLKGDLVNVRNILDKCFSSL